MTGSGRASTTRALAGGACRALGVIVLVVALDWSLGAVWQAATDPARPAPVATAVPAPDQGDLDPRVHSPALADAPWAPGYFAEFGRLSYDYLPYLYSQAATTRGRYINTRGGVRRSHEPDTTGPMPEVWFFGGSAMWGEGQRDQHTIASEISRIAEAEGLPVRVVNRGERAWDLWQETLLFEQRLTHEPTPDLAVFYDGANELGIQGQHPYPDPTVAGFDEWAESLTGRALEPGLPHAPPADATRMRTALSDLFDQYRSTSALGRVVQNVGSIFSAQPAAAQGTGSGRTDEEIHNAEDIYRRGRSVIQMLADRAGVRPMFFWQPAFGDDQQYRDIAQGMTPTTIDLTDTLDGASAPVYLDDIHTNEQGARIVAEAMWNHLRPQVAAWYADHPS